MPRFLAKVLSLWSIMEKHIEVNGTDVHYTVDGEGKPLVLMHGWGCCTSTLASIERTALESRKVVNIDFPGHGKSAEPPAVWGVEEYTRVLEAIVEAERLEKPALLGHSFGNTLRLAPPRRGEADSCRRGRHKAPAFTEILSQGVFVQGHKEAVLSALRQGTGRNQARQPTGKGRIVGLCQRLAPYARHTEQGGQRGPQSRNAQNQGTDTADMGRKRHGHPARRRKVYGKPYPRRRPGGFPRMRPLQLSRQSGSVCRRAAKFPEFINHIFIYTYSPQLRWTFSLSYS